MILKIYTVHDHVVGAHLQPFFARSEGEALRMVKQAVNEKATSFNNNPGDFALCYLGEFDDATGSISSERQVLVNLSSLVETVA